MNKNHIEIRPATSQDAEAISLLINSLSPHFTQDPEGKGAEAFLQTMKPEAIRVLIEAPNMLVWTAFVDGRLAGVAALRQLSHLYYLFVHSTFQNQGLGRQLWLHAKAVALAKGMDGQFTVNSTPDAVPVYERFGFSATGPRVDKNGICFVPMRYN